MVIVRKLSPSSARCIWSAVKELVGIDSDRVEHAKVIERLYEFDYSNAQAENILRYAVNEGLISKITFTDADSNSIIFYQIQSTSTEPSGTDWYCYECHGAGNVLICQTIDCNRVFHKSCIKTDEQKDKQWDEMNYHKNKLNHKSLSLKANSSSSRRRAISVCSDISMASELSDPVSDTTSIDSDLEKFCYACRIENKAKMSGTTIIHSSAEINYLLKFVYDRVHSWLPSNPYAEFHPNKITVTENINLSIKFLLRFNVTKETILNKLNQNQYHSYEQFLRDTLDMIHNLAIVFGKLSGECEAAKYLFVDALYEIGEVKRCGDCYRRSNEKLTTNWFAIPCTPRHELVYAKYTNYPYWPAKVIIKYDDKYDVRFFGGNHDRSTISARFIQPITANLKSLNGHVKFTSQLKIALHELNEYQKLLESPPDQFTFESEARAKTVSNNCDNKMTEKTSKKIKESKNKKIIKKSSVKVKKSPTHNEDVNEPGNTSKRLKISNGKPNNINSSTLIAANNITSSESMDAGNKFPEPTTSTGLKTDLPKPTNGLNQWEKLLVDASSIEEVKQIAKNEINKWKNNMQKLKEEYEQKLAESKRKQWCIQCLNEANYFCCWNTSYCSKDCQRIHWVSEHKLRCKRPR